MILPNAASILCNRCTMFLSVSSQLELSGLLFGMSLLMLYRMKESSMWVFLKENNTSKMARYLSGFGCYVQSFCWKIVH